MPLFGQDLTEQFNTKLSGYEEQEFKNWLAYQSMLLGRDLSRDLGDYDLRGLFSSLGQSGVNLTSGHGPDTYKKPSHPTFSNESIYSSPSMPGGSWIIPGTYIAPSMSAKEALMLREYFRKFEPNTKLELTKVNR